MHETFIGLDQEAENDFINIDNCNCRSLVFAWKAAKNHKKKVFLHRINDQIEILIGLTIEWYYLISIYVIIHSVSSQKKIYHLFIFQIFRNLIVNIAMLIKLLASVFGCQKLLIGNIFGRPLSSYWKAYLSLYSLILKIILRNNASKSFNASCEDYYIVTNHDILHYSKIA